MIDIQQIFNLRDSTGYYLLSDYDRGALQSLGNISVVRLKVTETELEYQKLLEVSMEHLLSSLEMYALFVEGAPQYKRKLRSYAGLFHWAKRKIGAEYFEEREFDLPENQSLFLGWMKVELPFLHMFLHNFLASDFAFGVFLDAEQASSFFREELLVRFFEEAIKIEKGRYVEIDWRNALVLLCRHAGFVYRLAYDGQDNQYLEFYGSRHHIEQWINEDLLVRLGENFYLRRRRSQMSGGTG